jgi:hypothetical protein
VVGCHTALDAPIAEQSQEQKLFNGKPAMPISSVLTASGVVVLLGDLVVPRLAGYCGRAEDRQRLFVAQGEQIIAVQYCKVRFIFLSSKSVDKASTWRYHRRWAGQLSVVSTSLLSSLWFSGVWSSGIGSGTLAFWNEASLA